ncbi:MAG: hypothetical protein B7X93_11630 [Hydrogenophilales bacterium 17-61-9]|nr:MAG: hypothetical protein B7X93_11630 [Hydrogenophilales bacterium 17-61-9]
MLEVIGKVPRVRVDRLVRPLHAIGVWLIRRYWKNFPAIFAYEKRFALGTFLTLQRDDCVAGAIWTLSIDSVIRFLYARMSAIFWQMHPRHFLCCTTLKLHLLHSKAKISSMRLVFVAICDGYGFRPQPRSNVALSNFKRSLLIESLFLRVGERLRYRRLTNLIP